MTEDIYVWRNGDWCREGEFETFSKQQEGTYITLENIADVEDDLIEGYISALLDYDLL